MNNAIPMIQPDSAALLVIDVQDGLLSAICEPDACVEACRRMIAAARLLNLPVLATEQYPQGLGSTNKVLKQLLTDVPLFTKTRFSACVEPVIEHLAALDRRFIITVGIEAHVCVQQTVLDLLRLGYKPCVCADGVSSRRPLDCSTALGRMQQAGAIITTTESVTLELAGDAQTALFKEILKIIK